MDINELTVKILFLAIPGIVAYLISKNLTIFDKGESFVSYIKIFVYTIISYYILSLILIAWGGDQLVVYNIVTGGAEDGRIEVIIGSIPSAIILSLILGLWDKFAIWNKMGKLFRVTNRFGDCDVWHFFNNMPDSQKNDGWVYVRDLKNGFTYYGYIGLFSDSGEERELVICDAIIYDTATGNELSKVGKVYLSRNKYDLTIEVPIDSAIDINILDDVPDQRSDSNDTATATAPAGQASGSTA